MDNRRSTRFRKPYSRYNICEFDLGSSDGDDEGSVGPVGGIGERHKDSQVVRRERGRQLRRERGQQDCQERDEQIRRDRGLRPQHGLQAGPERDQQLDCECGGGPEDELHGLLSEP